MTTGSDTPTPPVLPRSLLLAVAGLAALALLLGLLVIVLQLRPEPVAATPAQRELAAWEQVVRQQPDADGAQTGLGSALAGLGRDAEARAAFEEALARDEQDWVASRQLGLLLLEDDPARAEGLLAAAAEHAPRARRALALIPLGDLRLELGDPSGARDAFEAAIGDLPFVVDGHLGLGRALEALGDEEGARAAYERAARYDIDVRHAEEVGP